MARFETKSIQIVRETMALELNEVNERLRAAGERIYKDKLALQKTRSWVRKKDGTATPKRALRAGTFAEFVRNQPRDLPSDEVLRLAREAGITTGNTKQVAQVRSRYPAGKKTKAAPPKTPPRRTVNIRSPKIEAVTPIDRQVLAVSESTATATARNEFILAVMRIGLHEAENLLDNYRQAHNRLAESIKGSA